MNNLRVFKFWPALAVLSLLLVFTDCTKDDKIENTINSQFIGTWEHLEYPFDDVVFMIRLQFKEDGTYLADSWEIPFGIVKARKGDEGYGLNKDQATQLILSKTWDYEYISILRWSIESNQLIITGNSSEKEVCTYAFVEGKLIIPQDGENLVFTKK